MVSRYYVSTVLCGWLALLPCGAQVWSSLGPSPLTYATGPSNRTDVNSGRVSSIAVDPADPAHWLIGAGNGGVWESRDAGANWIPLTDDAATLAVGAVAFAPSDAKTIYVGTGESDGGVGIEHTGVGIMKSTDGAKTWTVLGASSFARASVKRIRVHPTNANIVLAITSRGAFGRDSKEGVPSSPPFGVLKSSDGGVTWVRTLTGQATALEIHPTDFNSQYAAIGDQRLPNGVGGDAVGSIANGVYRSTDAGQTWTEVAGPWGSSTITRATVGRIELAIAPSNANTLYASIQIPPNGGGSNTTLLGLYRTDNAWAAKPTWIQVPTAATGADGYCGSEKCGYSHVISVSPSDPNLLFAGGGDYPRLFRCANCGASPVWTNLALLQFTPHPDQHAMTWVGNRLILGNDGGVWSTADSGNTWQSHNATLSTGMFYSGALHPTNPNFILGGLRDFQISVRNGTKTWSILDQVGPNREWGEAEVAMSSSRPDTDWMAAWIFGLISRTTDGGKTGVAADAGIDKTGVAFIAPVRKCPSDDDVFVTGTNRMWRSDKFFSAASPSWIANGPPSAYQTGINFLDYPGTILEIAFAPAETGCSTYAYGIRGGQIQLTRDAGKTWKDLDAGGNLPARPVNGLAFDPTNTNILYAAFSSFDDATPGKPGHVFKTSNALAAAPTWVNVSPAMDQPFNVIRVDPTNPRLIYAGSDTGLWRSTDGAASWVHVGKESGMPNATIHDIQINPTAGTTAIFTYGRGAFGLGFPAGPEIASNSRSPANGATYIAGGLVPGSWAQVQGTGLSTATRIWNDLDFVGLGQQLPTKLSGVEVKVNGIAAAVYYVSPAQVSFQVPSGILSGPAGDVLTSSPVTVQVFRDGLGSNIVNSTGTSRSPGIFPVIVNGKNYPAGVFLDGKFTGDPADSPVFRKARPGDVIQLFTTGLERFQGGTVLGPMSVGPVTVTMGNITVPASNAVLVGPGEFQINVVVPQDFASLAEGVYPISIQYGGVSSPVTINSDPPAPMVIPIQH